MYKHYMNALLYLSYCCKQSTAALKKWVRNVSQWANKSLTNKKEKKVETGNSSLCVTATVDGHGERKTELFAWTDRRCDRLPVLLGNTSHPLINEKAHQRTFFRQDERVRAEERSGSIYYS